MKRRLITLGILLLIALIGLRIYRAKIVRIIARDRQGTTADYTCDMNKTVHAVFFSGNDPRAEISLSDGRKLSLKQAVSASGVRYVNADESIVFWIKGDTAFIQESGKETYSNCISTERHQAK